jgi:phage FluMu gp28-like protein
MCNPAPAAASIVDWAAIERCRFDYAIERSHLEAQDILTRFGQYHPRDVPDREARIAAFLRATFSRLFNTGAKHRLGFDVAASGEGDLASFYVDEVRGNDLWLKALLTSRTDDWHFLKTALLLLLRNIPLLQAAGDATGLGRQICWEAARLFPSRFLQVNFTSRKHDLGFSLMNQLSLAEKRFPRSELDIAADYSALRKNYVGARWVFSEGRNLYNPASHCDIAWAGALATEAHHTGTARVGSRLG